MNNPVAAGGVVAYLVTDTETGMTRVNEYKTIEGAAWMKQEPLVRESDLEALISDVAEYQASLTAECNARIAAEDALTAAQAEADRLRVDAERYRWWRVHADFIAEDGDGVIGCAFSCQIDVLNHDYSTGELMDMIADLQLADKE